MPDLPGRGKGRTPCCSYLVMGYVLWTVCASLKLNSMICVNVARRHSACFEILRKGGAQLRRLVSHFHPRLCYSVPIPPPLCLCKLRTWLTSKSCCRTKALVARRYNCWRDTEQVEKRAGCYLQVHRLSGTPALCHPPSFPRQWANPRGLQSFKLRKGLHVPK